MLDFLGIFILPFLAAASWGFWVRQFNCEAFKTRRRVLPPSLSRTGCILSPDLFWVLWASATGHGFLESWAVWQKGRTNRELSLFQKSAISASDGKCTLTFKDRGAFVLEMLQDKYLLLSVVLALGLIFLVIFGTMLVSSLRTMSRIWAAPGCAL